MRHRYQGKKLNRDTDHRRSLLKNLVRSLVEHEKIVTTQTKAKLAVRHFDRLMSRAKKGTVASRRELFICLQNRKLVQKAVRLAYENFKDRSSGFTRLVPLRARRGDGVLMTRVELVVLSATEEKKEPPKKEKIKISGGKKTAGREDANDHQRKKK